MTELRLCESCTIELASARTSDLLLGDSRPSKAKVCDCCSTTMRYEYIFVRLAPRDVQYLEGM